MLELVILIIIIGVHGIDPTPFSPSPAPLPCSLHAFELDNSYNQRCLENTVEKCEKKYIQESFVLEEYCIIHNLFSCIFKHPIHQKDPINERLAITPKYIRECFVEHRGIHGAQCLLDCYERQMNKH